MTACPAGHQSAAADYCDVCGIRVSPPAVPVAVHESGGSALIPVSATPTSPCPQCGAPGLVRFCEECGFAAGTQPAAKPAGPPETAGADIGRLPGGQPVTWTAVVTASRSYYDSVMAAGGPSASEVHFPDHCPVRRFQLTGSQMRIGRRSASKEVTPEIDLTGPPSDPGISRLHAILLAQPDGSWAVIDTGSENGTTLNDTEISTGQAVPLANGDTICIGAWTAVTIVTPP